MSCKVNFSVFAQFVHCTSDILNLSNKLSQEQSVPKKWCWTNHNWFQFVVGAMILVVTVATNYNILADLQTDEMIRQTVLINNDWQHTTNDNISVDHFWIIFLDVHYYAGISHRFLIMHAFQVTEAKKAKTKLKHQIVLFSILSLC